MIGTLKEKSSDLFYGLIGDFRGSKWLFQTPESFSQISPWLDYIDDQIVLMRDGSGITIIEFDGTALCKHLPELIENSIKGNQQNRQDNTAPMLF